MIQPCPQVQGLLCNKQSHSQSHNVRRDINKYWYNVISIWWKTVAYVLSVCVAPTASCCQGR